MKVFVIAAGLMWCKTYIDEHTTEQVYEREMDWLEENGGDMYGIGIRAEEGEIFWFHKKTKENEKTERKIQGKY